MCSAGKNSDRAFLTVAEIRKSVRASAANLSQEAARSRAEITRIYEDVPSSSDSNAEGGGRGDVQESGGDGRERRYGEASGGKYSRFQGNRVMTQFRKDR